MFNLFQKKIFIKISNNLLHNTFNQFNKIKFYSKCHLIDSQGFIHTKSELYENARVLFSDVSTLGPGFKKQRLQAPKYQIRLDEIQIRYTYFRYTAKRVSMCIFGKWNKANININIRWKIYFFKQIYFNY